jgi:hypothetical protein
LLAVLQKAKPVGQVEFKPDFFISFETHVNGKKSLKVKGHTIKGYENDLSYQIAEVDLLKDF